MTPDHDEEIGRALRSLEVPEHRSDFFETLARRLEEQPPKRLPTWGGRRPVFLLSAAAAILVAALIGTSLLPANRGGPQIASAEQVQGHVARALASTSTLTGQVAIECAEQYGPCQPEGGRTTLRWSFSENAAGDERVTGIGRVDDLAYRAAEHRQRTVTAFGETTDAQDISGLSAGPPDFPAARSVVRREYASVVRTFLDGTSATPVRETSYTGRAAWRLSIPVQRNKLDGPSSGDRLDVTVDRQTGFPLRITETLRGKFLHEIRLSGLTVNVPLASDAFTLTIPTGIRAFVNDAGFRPVPLADVRGVVGYAPVLPSKVPKGFKMSDVTVAARSGPTGVEGMNPPARNVVSVGYRRGFDRLTVTTRSTGPDATVWEDPLGTGEGFVDTPERVTITSGALTGSEASIIITPRGLPHAWLIDGDLVVTIAGDLSRAELVGALASFAT